MDPAANTPDPFDLIRQVNDLTETVADLEQELARLRGGHADKLKLNLAATGPLPQIAVDEDLRDAADAVTRAIALGQATEVRVMVTDAECEHLLLPSVAGLPALVGSDVTPLEGESRDDHELRLIDTAIAAVESAGLQADSMIEVDWLLDSRPVPSLVKIFHAIQFADTLPDGVLAVPVDRVAGELTDRDARLVGTAARRLEDLPRLLEEILSAADELDEDDE